MKRKSTISIVLYIILSLVSVSYAENIKDKSDKAFKDLEKSLADSSITDNVTLPAIKPSPKPAIKPIVPPALKPESKNINKPRPSIVKEKPSAVAINTKYPIKDGYPIWVLNPNIDGYKLSAVGAAKIQDGGLPTQKRVAKIQAQGELSRMVNVQVDNEINIAKTVTHNAAGGNISNDVSTYSRQRTSELLNSVVVIDEWVNSDGGEYFVLIGIAKE